MPYTEFLKWITFFEQQPYGWRDDYRAGVIAQSMGLKEPLENVFTSIRLLKAAEENSKKPDQALPKGIMLEKMLKAKSGDSLSVLGWLNGSES
jgi:hypothetical protein